MKKFFLSGLLGLFAINPTHAQESGPVVLELFTSQSCSSCPPADRVLSALSNDDNVIALSCNVTYWNHLHWEDTLSQEFCTQRQRQYVQEFNSRGPYTPQIVINGRHELVGSRGRQVSNIVEKEKGRVANILLEKSENGVAITLPEVAKGQYALSVVIYSEDHTQSIPSGENRGRTVSYTNPVTNIKTLGTWDGTAQNVLSDLLSSENNIVVLAQKNNAVGEIVAAGRLKKEN